MRKRRSVVHGSETPRELTRKHKAELLEGGRYILIVSIETFAQSEQFIVCSWRNVVVVVVKKIMSARDISAIRTACKHVAVLHPKRVDLLTVWSTGASLPDRAWRKAFVAALDEVDERSAIRTAYVVEDFEKILWRFVLSALSLTHRAQGFAGAEDAANWLFEHDKSRARALFRAVNKVHKPSKISPDAASSFRRFDELVSAMISEGTAPHV